jgi:cation diffusion facilitator CzcD-associated flavoprotein CzcO
LAFLPDADLFRAIQAGKASVETAEIERFSTTGLLLKSGKFLEADVVVSATGFNLCVMGDIEFAVDGVPVNFADTVTYRGMMFTGVPNLFYVFGYLRSSWTLRADLVSDFVCRLLNHMKARALDVVEVALRPEDTVLPRLPWIDPENFNPGYLMRSLHLLPKRLDKPEWQHSQDYSSDRKTFPAIDLDAHEFVYEGRRATPDVTARGASAAFSDCGLG